MKQLYSLFILALFLFIGCGKGANDNTEIYTENDAVFINLVKEYTLNDDGSLAFNYTHRLKYLTHNSFNRYFGETFVVYNPEFQELSINKCQTTQSDGNLIKSSDNAFNEVLPRFASSAPAYNHLREMVITHTGLELGAIVDLNYQINTKAGYWPELMGNEILQSTMPYKNYSIRVKIPKEKELKYELLNSEVQAKISTSGNQKIYEWNFKNMKGISTDHQSAEGSIPRLLFSTFKPIDDEAGYFKSLPLNTQNVNANIKSKANSLAANSETILEKALAIQHFVAHDFNFWPVPFEHTAYKSRSVNDIWNSAGGTALEKTILLSTMLSLAGIQSTPVCVLPEYYPKEMTNLLCFDDFLVRVSGTENENFYLSALHDENSDALISRQGKMMLEFSVQNNKPTEIKPVENNIDYRCDIQINENKTLEGSFDLKLTNYFNPFFILQKKATAVQNLMPFTTEAKLAEINKAESTISGKLKMEKFNKVQANYYFLSLPVYSEGINSWNLNILNKNRASAFELACPLNESYLYAFKMPKNLKMVTDTASVNEENEVGKVEIKISINDGIISIKRSIKLLKTKISPAEYELFRKLIVVWNTSKYKELIFKE